MRLIQFLVTNFRSVENSGWIDVDNVTALIGVNESGKTNLLVPLWKLNPATGGEIEPASDYPKKHFGAIRQAPQNYCFITAEFETGPLASELSHKVGITPEEAALVSVKRYFNGEYSISFPRSEGITVADAVDPVAVADVGGKSPPHVWIDDEVLELDRKSVLPGHRPAMEVVGDAAS